MKTVSVPLDALRALYAIWDAWENQVDCYDPGDMPGIASLIGVKGSWLMEETTDAFGPYAEAVRLLIEENSEDPRDESAQTVDRA